MRKLIIDRDVIDCAVRKLRADGFDLLIKYITTDETEPWMAISEEGKDFLADVLLEAFKECAEESEVA